MKKLLPDTFTCLLVCAVIVASLLPISGQPAQWFSVATNVAIAILFFLHGARLSRDVVIAGGVSTLRHYLNAGAVDMLHLQIAPIVLGAGECLWHGLTATLEPIGARATRFTTHMDYRVVRP